MNLEDNSINLSKFYELGRSQTAKQKAVLENEGITNLENRIQLLGYYSKCQTREDANKWKLLFESLICDNLELGFLGTVAVPQGLSPIAFAGLRDVLLSSFLRRNVYTMFFIGALRATPVLDVVECLEGI